MLVLEELLARFCTKESGFQILWAEAIESCHMCLLGAVSPGGGTITVTWDGGNRMLVLGHSIAILEYIPYYELIQTHLADCNLKLDGMLRVGGVLLEGNLTILCQAALKISEAVAESSVLGDLVISNIQQFWIECEMLSRDLSAIVGPHTPRH